MTPEAPLENFKTPARPDEHYVRRMFDAFADRYDIFTALIGFGQAGRLRNEALKGLRPGMRVLDLACGTGDLALAAAARLGQSGTVAGLDLSPRMLEKAALRLEKKGLGATTNVRWILKSATDLPMENERFDLILSGFALRNLYEHIEPILSGVHASLSDEGAIAFLDLTEPVNPFLRAIYRFYMFVFVGMYGLVLFGKNYPVSYLPQSASRFFKAHEFTEALARAGFRNISKKSFLFGSVTLYRASK